MSNVLYFQQAIAARNARAAERAGYLSGVGAFGAYDEKVKQAQIALTFVGFPAGKVDGLWGNDTRQAARSFRAAAGLDPDPAGGTAAAYLDAAFDTALGRAVANRKGTAAAPVPGMTQPVTQTGGGGGGAAPALPPGVSAQMPWHARAKDWLLAPGQPVYKKPVLYVGAGILGLTIFLALRRQD